MDKKITKVFGGVIAFFIVFIIILFFLSRCSSKKAYTYEKLEEKMMDVAKNYYENNPDELPNQDGDEKTYTLKKMIEKGKISELSELFNDESIKCDGNVAVRNNDGNYLYTPYLKCGNDYETKYLKDEIINNSLVTEGYGLYEVGNEYIFKGETVNNYLSWNDKTYRIIRINEDGSIRVMEEKSLSSIYWDTRYNSEYEEATGINEYYMSALNSKLKETTDDYYNDEFTDEQKAYINTQNLCVGKRYSNDTTNDGSTECSNTLETKLGHIAVYEYIQASLDTDCQTGFEASCYNYNWLSRLGKAIWTITANAENSKEAYVINGKIALRKTSFSNYVYVVFNLNERTQLISGSGSKEDPYIIQKVSKK